MDRCGDRSPAHEIALDERSGHAIRTRTLAGGFSAHAVSRAVSRGRLPAKWRTDARRRCFHPGHTRNRRHRISAAWGQWGRAAPRSARRGDGGARGGGGWEAAQPIRDALKSPLHEAFEGKYVIAVIGIPLLGEQARREDEPQDSLESLKGLTSLDIKGKSYIQPDEVRRQIGT